jgi:LPS O-antigen subunit length determinant protein (WzzB/FepE family)
MTDKSKEPNRYYYSTYASDIYAEAEHSEKDVSARKEDGKHIQSEKRHWSLNVIFNVRMIIIIVAIVISSIFFSSRVNNDPQVENFQVGVVVAPPSVIAIKDLQIPEVGNIVNKRIIFEDFIANIKSAKLAARFSSTINFADKLKIRRDSKSFESVDSVQIYIIGVKQPEAAKQWLSGFLSFAAEKTVNRFIKLSEQKIEDKKDQITLEIDAIYKDAEEGNKELRDKIKRYTTAMKKAQREGIINPIDIADIPEEDRFGDLLYLQGSWKLEAEVERLKTILEKKVVDVSEQQIELKKIIELVPENNNIQAFYLEQVQDVKDLNPAGNRQLVWSIVGAIIGLLFGLIISYPFRRKKVS